MAAKGTVAKQNVVEMIKKAFGENYIGEFDKKIYVVADDGGEKVQIALAMTCPKTPVNVVNTKTLNYNTGLDFSDSDYVEVPKEKSDISEDERKTVIELMKRMGL